SSRVSRASRQYSSARSFPLGSSGSAALRRFRASAYIPFSCSASAWSAAGESSAYAKPRGRRTSSMIRMRRIRNSPFRPAPYSPHLFCAVLGAFILFLRAREHPDLQVHRQFEDVARPRLHVDVTYLDGEGSRGDPDGMPARRDLEMVHLVPRIDLLVVHENLDPIAITLILVGVHEGPGDDDAERRRDKLALELDVHRHRPCDIDIGDEIGITGRGNTEGVRP